MRGFDARGFARAPGADAREWRTLTLWPANVRRHSFRDQVDAASEAGYDAIAINSATYVASLQAGLRASDLRRMADDAGIRVSWVDAVTGWLPIRYPPHMPELRDFLDHHLDVAFEIAETFDCEKLLAIGCFDQGAIPPDEQARHLAALCERAGKAGLAVALEFIPMWGIDTLAAAWSLVRQAGAGNAGLMIDTWHFHRSASSLAQLEDIPAERIAGVQLADALSGIRGGSLLADCLEYRLPPGEGELPLRPLLAALARKGVDDWGPEIFSLEMDRLEAVDAAKAGLRATLSALRDAGEARVAGANA